MPVPCPQHGWNAAVEAPMMDGAGIIGIEEGTGPSRDGATQPSPVYAQRLDRVLILTQWYWPELIGTGFYSADLAEWLAGKGSQVAVITNRPSYPGTKVFP